MRLSWIKWSVRRGGAFGPEGATSEELEPNKIPSARVGLLWSKKSSAPNSPLRGSINVRPTHACSDASYAGKSSSSSYVDDDLVASKTKRGEERLVASLTATPRSGVRSGAGAVFIPHRLQCAMLNLE